MLEAYRSDGTVWAAFSYNDNYLTTPRAFALDPELQLAPGTARTRAGAPMFGAVTDSGPDRWGRFLVERCEIGRAEAEGRSPHGLGEGDYLLAVRDELRQGALRVRADSPAGTEGTFLAADDADIATVADLPDLLTLADRAERGAADLQELQRLARAGCSVGGARPKVHVRDRDGRIVIAKFPATLDDRWNVIAWE